MRWFFFSFQLEHSRISGWHVAITSVEGATSCHSSFPFETVTSSRSRHLLNLIIRRNVYRLTGVTVVVYSNTWIVFIIWCRSSRQTGNGQNRNQQKENLSCAKITSTNYGEGEKKNTISLSQLRNTWILMDDDMMQTHEIKQKKKGIEFGGSKVGTDVYPWECKADLSVLAVNGSRFLSGWPDFFTSDRKTERPSTYNQVEKTKDDFSLFFFCLLSPIGKILSGLRLVLFCYARAHTILCIKNMQQCNNQCRKEVFSLCLVFYNAHTQPCPTDPAENGEIHGRKIAQFMTWHSKETSKQDDVKNLLNDSSIELEAEEVADRAWLLGKETESPHSSVVGRCRWTVKTVRCSWGQTIYLCYCVCLLERKMRVNVHPTAAERGSVGFVHFSDLGNKISALKISCFFF